MNTDDVELMPARLKALRKRQGLGVETLAAKAGLSRAYLYRIESGERPNASAVTVGRLAYALGTSVEYLIGLVDDPSPPRFAQYPPSEARQAWLRRLEEGFERLSVEAQASFLEAVLELLDHHRSGEHVGIGEDAGGEWEAEEQDGGPAQRAGTAAA